VPSDQPRSRARHRIGRLAGIVLAALAWSAPAPASAVTASTVGADVVVYGGTPGGVIAAYTAARAGATVILVEPTAHLGGMMSSGLTNTDIGDPATIGGYARDFFERVQAKTGGSLWRFAPHVAERVATDMLAAARVRVIRRASLATSGAVTRSGSTIVSILLTTGVTVVGKVFIDASYTGDLLAGAGVSWRLGRESTTSYGESLAGVRPALTAQVLPWSVGVPPYLSSPPGPVGSADDRVQDSSYRLCLSSDRLNQTAFAAPPGYDPARYASIASYLTSRAASQGTTAKLAWVLTLAPVGGGKYDTNASGPASMSLPGQNWGYATASATGRAAIERTHRIWAKGFLYFLRHDARVPAAVRSTISAYGLCRDEFTDNGNWPWQLYIREARRMVGTSVLVQKDVVTDLAKWNSIGEGSHRSDAHFASRWFDPATRTILVEGWIAGPERTYQIPYSILTPRATEVTNLLVPVAVSASHVAWSSVRMEPQFMIMGEAAGEAAVLAIRLQVTVQSVPVPTLQARLKSQGAIFTASPLPHR
jgi:hypothetical protein